MVSLGYPVVMDCTHACQSLSPGQTKTSGRKEMAPLYAQSASLCGTTGFFAETYDIPENAKSDSSTSLSFTELEYLISSVSQLQ